MVTQRASGTPPEVASRPYLHGYGSGADVLVINLTKGEVINVDLKHGGPHAIRQRAASKTPAGFNPATSILVPDTTEGTITAHAGDIASGKQLAMERGADDDKQIVLIENQLSALTSQFKAGLEKAIAELKAALEIAPKELHQQLQKAITVLRAALDRSPTVTIRRLLRSSEKAAPAQKRTIEKILHASAGAIGPGAVAEDNAIAKLDDDNIIKS